MKKILLRTLLVATALTSMAHASDRQLSPYGDPDDSFAGSLLRAGALSDQELTQIGILAASYQSLSVTRTRSTYTQDSFGRVSQTFEQESYEISSTSLLAVQGGSLSSLRAIGNAWGAQDSRAPGYSSALEYGQSSALLSSSSLGSQQKSAFEIRKAQMEASKRSQPSVESTSSYPTLAYLPSYENKPVIEELEDEEPSYALISSTVTPVLPSSSFSTSGKSAFEIRKAQMEASKSSQPSVESTSFYPVLDSSSCSAPLMEELEGILPPMTAHHSPSPDSAASTIRSPANSYATPALRNGNLVYVLPPHPTSLSTSVSASPQKLVPSSSSSSESGMSTFELRKAQMEASKSSQPSTEPAPRAVVPSLTSSSSSSLTPSNPSSSSSSSSLTPSNPSSSSSSSSVASTPSDSSSSSSSSSSPSKPRSAFEIRKAQMLAAAAAKKE